MTAALRVLVVGLNYAPDLIGIAKYTTELCEDLARRGFQVEVVTAPPYYPAWRVPEDYRSGRRAMEVMNGVRLWRRRIDVPARPSGLKRLLHLMSFGLAAMLPAIGRARAMRPDLVFCVAPALFGAPAALMAARVAGATSWLHIQDFELDAAFELGLLKGGLARRLGLGLERALLKAFDRVSTISPKMVERLAAKGVAPDRALEIRNWVDVEETTPRPSSDTALRRELGISAAAPVLLYSGNMAAKQGLEVIAEAAEALQGARPDAVFLLVGNGPLRPRLEALCQGRTNVRFMDLQPAGRVPEVLATADIHLLPQRAEAADLVLPSKLAPMLASGRPVAAMAAPGSSLAAEIEGAGLVTDPHDPGAWTAALMALIDNPDLRRRFGAAGRRRALERWDRRKVIDHLVEVLAGQREGRGT
jgi:colanic acid biosynthesis glycosyl transferase WcaI